MRIGAGQRHDLDRARASLSECGRGSIGRRAGRVDVIDEHDAGGNAPVREECARDVPTPLVLCQPSLARRPSGSRQERLGAEAPTQQRARSPAARPRGVHASACDPDRPGRRRHTRRPVARTDSRTTAAAQRGEPAQTALLPGATTGRSRSSYASTARACANASRRPAHSPQRSYRPGRRRTATRAERRLDAAQAAVQPSQTCAPGRSRRDSVEGGADRARHHARGSACVTCLCQLGEYSARSGRPRRRAHPVVRLEQLVASPMSNHWPSKRYA